MTRQLLLLLQFQHQAFSYDPVWPDGLAARKQAEVPALAGEVARRLLEAAVAVPQLLEQVEAVAVR